MDNTALQLFVAILTLSTFIISIITMFNKKELFLQTLSKSRSLYKRKAYSIFKSFFKVYRNEFLLVMSSLFLASAFIIISLYFMPASSDYIVDPAETNSITASPSITGSFVTPPIEIDSLDKIYLDELSPIISNNESFFMNSSDNEGFKKIGVDGENYSHGMVIKSSTNGISDFSRVESEESIEFALRKEYQGLTFSLGVDESTFDDIDISGPECICRVVLQAIGPDSVTQGDENILFDSSEFDYRLKKSDAYVDLTGVDILRITAHWTYDKNSAIRSSINIAIVDPVLYHLEP